VIRRSLPKPEAEWVSRLFPTAGEAVIVFHSARSEERTGRGDGDSSVPAEQIAARRAVTHVRRYCVANILTRLGTLTYAGAGCHDPVGLRGDVRRFFRELRAEVGSGFPYLWTAEWHPGGHGLHVRLAYKGRRLRPAGRVTHWFLTAFGTAFEVVPHIRSGCRTPPPSRRDAWVRPPYTVPATPTNRAKLVMLP
jgi:hypothetical protein